MRRIQDIGIHLTSKAGEERGSVRRVHFVLCRYVLRETIPALCDKLKAAGYDYSVEYVSKALTGGVELDAGFVGVIATVLGLEKEEFRELAATYYSSLEEGECDISLGLLHADEGAA